MERHARLRPLSSDHHRALVLARRIRRAGEAGGLTADFRHRVISRFREELEPHFAAEEPLLVALAGIGETALVERARDEHARLRALIDDGGEEALRRFGQLLRQHVRFEEKELFEVAQQRLGSELPDAERGRR